MARSTTLAVSLGLAIGGLLSGVQGCKVQSIFTCLDDSNCEMQGAGGQCEANSFCTFPDEECASGRRWHDRAGDLSNECLDTGGGSGSGSGTGSGGSGDDMPPGDSSGATTAPMTSAGSSSGSPPGTTTGMPPADSSSGGGSSGAAGTCDAQYGAATDYMPCGETVDECTFSTTTMMVMSCNDVCAMFGGTCVGAQSNDVDLCVSTGDTTCDDTTTTDQICICSNDG